MLNFAKRRFSAACNCALPSSAATSLSRRDVLAGGTAALALSAMGGFASNVLAKAAAHRIDVHHHIVPPTWLAAMETIGEADQFRGWSVQSSLEDMDMGGVATAMTSVPTPQVTPLSKQDAVRIARESNEFAKQLTTDHPGRFGVWALLPLPHIDESLQEIAYAFDTLQLDGVGIMTSYVDKWLGYNDFQPVWEELNLRKATVYTHPTSAACCANLVELIADAAIEFGTDTTRSIASLIFSGTSLRFKDINWIWSHGGGALTAVADRFLVQLVNTPPHEENFTRQIVEAELQRFYYDTAQVANDITLSAMIQLMPISQIVYGTDFPFRTAADHTRGVMAFFRGADLRAVERGNALRLIPRLA